jgi:ethanolamine utilization cobalamin adenosyltransferase
MEKQEHRTYLSAGDVVDKVNPRIEFRGRLDSLIADVVSLQAAAKQEGLTVLVEELEEIREKLRDILICEVVDKPCDALSLWGLSSDEIRERSHHPEKHFGLGHILPHHTMGIAAAGLNSLRTRAREAELSACRAFDTSSGNPSRLDVVGVMNRLSSAFYVLTYKYLPENYDKTITFSKGRER